MAKTTPKRKIHKNRRARYFLRREVLLLFAVIALIGAGLYLKQTISYYYALYFDRFEHKKLKNSEFETYRINRIVTKNIDKTFGFDMSHYQNPADIKWDSLSIGNKTIPLEFVVLRATMGNRSADRNFDQFWEKAKENDLIRGAYHFYRPDEDPVMQANSYLSRVKLEEGDLRPVLDIEKMPRRKSREQYLEDVRIWLKIVEEAYGEKPIIYTYYHFYKDHLRGEFDDYPLWLANYNDVDEPSPQDNWAIWQFTEKGIAYGVNTKIDLNIFNGNLWSLKKLTLD